MGLLGLTTAAVARGDWAVAIGERRFFQLIALQLVLLVGSALWTRFRTPGPRFLFAMFTLDVAAASILSAWTGGAGSLLVFLYFPVIAAGAYLLGRRGALVVAVLSAVGLIGVGWYAGTEDGDQLLAYWEIGFRVLSFVLVGLLSGQLAESLERTGKELQFQRVTSEVVLARVRAGVLIVDPNDRIVEVNSNGRLLLGDIVGKRVTEVFTGAVYHRAWEETTEQGRHLVCSQAPLPAQERVVVVEDVTDLWEMRERAERDQRLIGVGRLAAGLAHEIRNPLASIMAILQMLREDRPNRQVDLALGEAERLNRLVDEFLEASRTPTLRRSRIDVAAIAAMVTEAFGADPRFLGSVTVHLEAASVTADIDPDRIRQVLWNLLTNAAQAMPGGGKVGLRVEAHPDVAVIHVTDEGVGVAAAELPHIFDPFFTRRAGGTGLGLALVDQIIRIHGGSIGVVSAPGAGTTFTIRLPLGAAS